MTIAINNTTTIEPQFNIADWINKISEHLDLTVQHIELTLMSESEIQTLNNEHFNQNCSTDTISFNLDSSENIVGDIYLCPQKITKNAKEFNHSIDKEFKIVIIHSILHLIGYIDTTNKDYAMMLKKQNEIYQQLTHES